MVGVKNKDVVLGTFLWILSFLFFDTAFVQSESAWWDGGFMIQGFGLEFRVQGFRVAKVERVPGL